MAHSIKMEDGKVLTIPEMLKSIERLVFTSNVMLNC